jgi:hypothetical protein
MQLIANAPFLHYVTNCTTFGHADGYAAGAKCVTASIDTIETLQFLQDRSLLDGSHSVVVCSLVYAATALLQIELADARIPCLDRVKEAILAAQSLFFALGCQHSIVSKCYQSLQVWLVLTKYANHFYFTDRRAANLSNRTRKGYTPAEPHEWSNVMCQ